MISFQLLGPSGVGKSYWYNRFIQKYPQYEPKELLLKRIREKEEYKNLPLKLKGMFLIYRLNLPKISNRFEHKLFAYFYKGFQRKSKTLFNSEKDDKIIKTYLESVIKLQQPQITILKNIHYFHDKLIELKFHEYYLKENDIYLVEDGLMHICPIFLKEFTDSKCIILNKDLEIIKEQRLQRAKNNPTTFVEYMLNAEELKDYMDYIMEVYSDKTKEYMASRPENCIQIDADQEDVIQRIFSFIKSFE